MRSAGMIAAGVMSVWMLVGCGGMLEETAPGAEAGVEALYACPIDRPCPGTTQCVNGLCRDCQLQPSFCARTGDIQGLAQGPTIPGGPGPVTYPYCWKAEGTACTTVNTQITCTDGIYTDYKCICLSNHTYHCDTVR